MGEASGESDRSVSPSLAKESVGVAVRVGVVVILAGVEVVLGRRVGVLSGEVSFVEIIVAAAAGVAVKSVKTGVAVGVSAGEQLAKSITVKDRANQH